MIGTNGPKNGLDRFRDVCLNGTHASLSSDQDIPGHHRPDVDVLMTAMSDCQRWV